MVGVHPANEVAVRVFLACQTQWRSAPLSTWAKAELRQTGLDYAGVESAARLLGLAMLPDDFTRIRLMEAEALEAFAEARR